ncbi:hypothetical protein DICSQDRAFT_136930 [Dichomitus squalens LYAD-421 SS1]|uniref:Uncharacterized protein n=1 Tax=Dichomitus squalens (strain LYAD-421) TaxID=732165 RepID=R7SY01_DICSQ|nr:uncharacterized protein DICSQDRAFT_136930 [Dichomitus squalens LYAD-421 SS1]EJF60971.1 hypothetical protein DICSQDRAFT_136930 [Dichomitus squalens LYAD-421 SS1]
MATPFSDITSDSSEASLASEPDDGRYSRNHERKLLPMLDLDLEKAGTPQTNSSAAWLQWRAEQGRAAHIARGEAATSRANPYAGPALVGRAQAPWADAGVRMNHGWERMFRAASVTNDAQVRKKFADDIVNTGKWEEGTSEVLALAGMLVERAAEGDAQGFVSVAPFARNLHESFKRKNGAVAAEFHGQLRRCIWEEFEAWWQPGKPTALSSFKYKGKPQALTASLAVATLIGDLFTVNLVPPETVILCLQVLIGNMFAVEQARAVRAMLSRVDARLKDADPAAVDTVLAAFCVNVDHVKTSFIGEFKDTDVKAQYDDVETIYKRWDRVREMYTQGHSVAYPSVSETDDTPVQPSFPTLTPTAIWQPAPRNTPVISYRVPAQNPPA